MSRKRIAVFICAICMDNQKKILKGILAEAGLRGYLCYFFTCHQNYLASVESQEGAYQIMRLPDLSYFDGGILLKNTLQYAPAADALEKRIREAGLPCVSVDQELPGMSNVMVDNYEAERRVMDYLIREKGAKTLNFVGGYPGNEDGEERLRAFRDGILEHGLPLEEERIRNGNYSLESGAEIMSAWLGEKVSLPDAIVCANDQMAIGVLRVLQESGYSVPEDTEVVGFDGEDLCNAYRPRITTVKKEQARCGRAAVRLLTELWEGKSPRTEWIRATLCPSESTGDALPEGNNLESLRGEFVEQTLVMRAAGNFIRNMASDLAQAYSIQDFCEILKRFIIVGDMSACYFCACSDEEVFHRSNSSLTRRIDLDDINTTYTERVSVPVSYRKNGFCSFPPYSPGQILPLGCEEEDKASFYVVTPVHFHRCCYGFFVSADSYFALQTDLYFLWNANLGIALENIRKWLLMNDMVGRLNEMWVYDAMTGLYNRAGFLNLAGDLLRDMKKDRENAFMLFLDLDGLKRINDTLGHECGDRYISAMGEILRKVKEKRDLAMRFGGDEFVLFGSRGSREEAEKLVCRIEEEMKKRSFEDGSYHLEASIGLSYRPASEIPDLDNFLREADEKMYELKKQKKHR